MIGGGGGRGEMRFYTLPPKGVWWPWLLVNPRNYRQLFTRKFRHAILDSGVMLFADKNVDDYPRWFMSMWKRTSYRLSQIFCGELWVVIPDYPDDYHPGQFGDNVERTLRNIREFMSIDGVEWLPVIQSRYLNRLSFVESCHKTKDVIGDYPRVAIGTVCKCRKLDFIEYCCKMARRIFPKSWIHAFGLTLNALPRVKDYINSFDSLAYTFPRERGKPSCKNISQRVRYFYEYLRAMDKWLGDGEGGVQEQARGFDSSRTRGEATRVGDQGATVSRGVGFAYFRRSFVDYLERVGGRWNPQGSTRSHLRV